MGCYETREPELEDIHVVQDFTTSHQFQFYAAIRSGKLELISEYIKKGYNINYKMINFARRTPLHLAAEIGSKTVIEFLISNGAMINARDPQGVTPILLAAGQGHRECVLFLVSKGASLTIVTGLETMFQDYVPEKDRAFYKRELARITNINMDLTYANRKKEEIE